MNSISSKAYVFIFDTKAVKLTGELWTDSVRLGDMNLISLGILFQILGPVHRIDWAHLTVEEDAGIIVVRLLVEVLDVRVNF